jgi:RecJ-like exonuclease
MSQQTTSPFECTQCEGTGYRIVHHRRVKCKNCEGRGIITNANFSTPVKELRLKREQIDRDLTVIRNQIKQNKYTIDICKIQITKLCRERKLKLRTRKELQETLTKCPW